MVSRAWLCIISLLTCFFILGCASIRFSKEAPEAKDFHPQTLALIALEAGGYEGVKEPLEEMILGELKRRNWFRQVWGPGEIYRLMEQNEEIRRLMGDYLAKLRQLNFSDGELSKKIFSLTGMEAFLLVSVDFWYYTKEAGENIAKVGLTMKLYDTKTGKQMWKGGHHQAVSYVLMKPELTNLAKEVVKQMIGVMPH